MNKQDLSRLKYIYMPPMDRLQSLVKISAVFIDTKEKDGTDYFIRINSDDIKKQIVNHRSCHPPKLSRYTNYEFDPNSDTWLKEQTAFTLWDEKEGKVKREIGKIFDTFDECIDYFYTQFPRLKDE